MEQQIIKDVALYLRKSRGEGDKDLDKHKAELLELVEDNKWTPTIYSEIASGDSLDYRPKMLELLEDVKEDMYDAVAVVDYDRLGRGDDQDAATIRNAFRTSDTLIITPQQVFDLKNDTDIMLSELLGMMARFEYRQIKKRLQRGKKRGAKEGAWVNGPPPFPYDYNADTKRLVINEDKRTIYDYIKREVLRGEPTSKLAQSLNRQGHRTPKDKHWTAIAIKRMLSSEVHLGHTLYGKTKGSGHLQRKTEPLEKVARSDWTITRNTHEPVLSEEEYATLKELFERKAKEHPRTRMHAKRYSGLVRCGNCGYARSFVTKTNAKGETVVSVKPCQVSDAYGNRCGNGGGLEKYVDAYVYNSLNHRAKELETDLEGNKGNDKEQAEKELKLAEKQLEKAKAARARVMEMYEEGDYTKTEFQERKAKRNSEISVYESTIHDLKERINYYEQVTNEDRLEKIGEILEIWDSETSSFNKLLRQIIDCIYFKRDEENNINIQVVYR